jgi:eukaryotic-like serine/threonine-protein kinase
MNAIAPRPPSTPVGVSLREQTRAVKQAWENGDTPDTLVALATHPDLAGDKSSVLALAYEEYVLRSAAGAPPPVDEFLSRFPACRSSLRVLLQCHHDVDGFSPMVDEAGVIEWPAPGEQLDDLTLLRDLGQGTFARAYLAAETSVGGRAVVVKLSYDGAEEAHTLGRLGHPNIVPILSARVSSAWWTEVRMPFLGAATLHDLLDQAFPTGPGPTPAQAVVILHAARARLHPADPELPDLPPPHPHLQGSYFDGVAWLGVQLADALAFLHGRGVIHRDLKPSNVLLDANGRPLLLDFNLSADARGAPPRVAGTLPYMPPEQVLRFSLPGESNHTSPSSSQPTWDIYSLGSLLYQLLTGELPFGYLPPGPVEQQVVELRKRHQFGFRPLRTVNPVIPSGLARVIERCLAADPRQRPSDATALASALRQYFSPTRPLSGGRRLVVALSALLVAAAAGGTPPRSFAPQPAQTPLTEARYLGEYRLGRQAYEQGDYAAASAHFHKALKDRPDHQPSQFAHARCRLLLARKLTDFSDARALFTDINKGRKNHPDGLAKACEAYCLAQMGGYPASLAALDEAEQASFQGPALYNNRAVGLLKSREPNKFALAQEALDKALELEKERIEIRYNRALLVWDDCFSNQQPIPRFVLKDVGRLVEQQPTADVLYLAACLHAAASARADNPAADQERALDLFNQALNKQFDPKSLSHHLNSARLDTEPRFAKLIREHIPPQGARFEGPPLAYRLLDPAPRLPE